MSGQTVLEVPLADGARPFTVRGLDRTAWTALISEHPSEDPRWRYDADTLNPDLVRQCVTAPAISLELAGQLVDDPDVGPDLVDTCLQLTEPGSLEWARRRLATDARLVAEVSAAVRMGIPHEQFTSWPTRSQDLALAFLESQARVCPGCGVPEVDMGNPLAWEPDMTACVHCGVLEETRATVPEDARHRVHVHLVRPERVT